VIKVAQGSANVMIVPSDVDIEVSGVHAEVLADAPPRGLLYLNGVALSDAIYNDTKVVFEHGDRGAFDMSLYPERHASDVENDPRYHVPWPASSGQAPISDGSKYVATDIASQADLDAHIALANPHNTDFPDLTDTPADYVGHGSKMAVVKATEDGLDFASVVSVIDVIIDGGGAQISTGVKNDIEIPFNCTLDQVTLLADQSGSIVIDIWKDTYANYPPTDADSITSSSPPTITTALKSKDSTLSGWTTAITDGDTLRFNVDSCTTIQKVTISLRLIKGITAVPTASASVSPTPSSTPSPSPSASESASVSPSTSPSSSESASASPSESASPSPTPSASQSPSASVSPTPSPSTSPSSSISPSASVSPTPSSSVSASPS